jgi:selenocysteine-specific elongation factor
MIIGTAGHIDHGKTALVKAVTGVDADRLAEEKRRGITIDLGFAYTDTPLGTFGFVDVPGHERFVHTMLAGATGIDAALLVVALNDGVMPQTQEHAAILDLLGIDRGVIALTKSDIAVDNIPLVTAEVRTLLAATALRDAAIVPVSAVTGDGVANLAEALRALGPRPRDAGGHPRLAVDRAFTLAGAGLVVTGTLVAGRIAVEDRLVLSPPGLELRVRGLHAQNRTATVAEAGQRVALNITGPRLAKDAVTRGDWVLHPDIHAPTIALDIRLRVLAEEPGPVRADMPVHLHLGAAHVMARLHPLDRDRIQPGDDALVRLTLARPIGALAGDRLVLRDAAASRTIGGGSVVDPFPPSRGRRTPGRLAQLAALEAPSPDAALRAMLALPPGWTDRARFALARNLKADAADAALQAAQAVTLADLLMASTTAGQLRRDLLQGLAAWHAAAPEQPGLQPERLRQSMPQRPPPAAFRALLDSLLRQGAIRQDGPWLRLATHRLQLSAADERLWPQIRDLLMQDRFRPPRARDLARSVAVPEAAMRGTLKRLQRIGALLELAPDHFFPRETVAELAQIVAAVARDHPEQQVTAAAFRDRLDNGRKVAIQILEYFDRAGLTQRSGDVRTVREDRLALFGPLAPPSIEG